MRRKNNYKTSETNPLTVIEKNLNVKQVYDFASKPLKLLHYEEAESAGGHGRDFPDVLQSGRVLAAPTAPFPVSIYSGLLIQSVGHAEYGSSLSALLG